MGLALTTMMVLLVGCNPYNKMQKNVGKIDAYATPEVLALKGQTVEADITYTFPKKYFYEEMILKVTPVLVFEGGEVAGTPKYFQGEDVRDNYTPVRGRMVAYLRRRSFSRMTKGPIFRRSFSAWRAVRPTSAVVTSSKLSATSAP